MPLFGYIYFARDDQITSLGNHLALIDIANGRLIDAPLKDNPGASIYDYRQPTSNETCACYQTGTQRSSQISLAHQVCAGFVFIGWDVAFTERGPIILEGNENWCADTYQTLNGKPLGCTKFADILAMRLKEDKQFVRGTNNTQDTPVPASPLPPPPPSLPVCLGASRRCDWQFSEHGLMPFFQTGRRRMLTNVLLGHGTNSLTFV